jgi:hypothetical protein
MEKEAHGFAASIKEPDYVVASPEMIQAGIERLRDLADETDESYLVRAVYMAMEYERRSRS